MVTAFIAETLAQCSTSVCPFVCTVCGKCSVACDGTNSESKLCKRYLVEWSGREVECEYRLSVICIYLCVRKCLAVYDISQHGSASGMTKSSLY